MTLFGRVWRRLGIIIENGLLAVRHRFRPRSALHWDGTGVYRLGRDYAPPDPAQFDAGPLGEVGRLPLTDGWSLAGGEGGLDVDGGRLRVTTHSADTEIRRTVDFPASSVSAIKLTMQVPAGSQAMVSWLVRGHPEPVAGKQEVWLRPGRTFQRYRVPVGERSAWRGQVCELRIRPSDAAGGAVAVMEEIALEREPLAQQLAASGQSVRQVGIRSEIRRALFAPTPTVIERRIRIPPGGVLQLGFGVMLQSWWSQAGPVHFRVSLTGAAGGVTAVLNETIQLQQEASQWRWHDREVDLSAFANQRMTLRLETTRGLAQGAAEGPVLAVWGDPCLFSGATRADSRPNIVIISVDSLRADRLGCYGYGRPTSPEIGRLAAEGVRFSRAISQSTWTLPSHLSLLTSRYPFEYGDTTQNLRPRPEIKHLAELLGEAGYATGAVTGGAYLGAAFGFARGFDRYREWGEVDGFVQAACDWVQAKAFQPFFLFLHTFEVHNYFLQSGHSLAEFESGYVGKVRPGFDLLGALVSLSSGRGGLEEADIEHVKSLYDGEVRCADAALGRIFAKLRELGLWEKTLIILLSDHGEAFGEHGEFMHSQGMYEEAVRVPLIMKPPAGVKSPASRVFEGTVELTDIAPTALEFTGLDSLKQMVGQSLLPVVRGEQPLVPREKIRTERAALCEAHGTRWALSTNDWKYESLVRPVPLAPEERLHDLRTDPEERENVIGRFPEVAAEFRDRLPELVARRGRGYRLLLAAKRPTILRLRSSAPVRYVQVPVLSPHNALAVSEDRLHLELRVERPEAVLILLGLEVGATLEVSGECRGQPLTASQVRLGASGAPPPHVPFRLGAEVRFEALRSEEPPRGDETAETTLWLWRPRAEEEAEAPPPDVDGETRKQLRALGYVD